MLALDNTVLVIVDLQVKLLAVIHERDRLIDNACRLVRGMLALEAPVVWTEQNPDGLGKTTSEIADLLGVEAITKLSFSCCGEPAFTAAMEGLGRRQVLLAGIETHVCVYQTAADLLAAGYEVQVVGDACSSRTPENKQVGLARIAGAGAGVTSVETALFELLKVAEGPRFKEILRIVK